MALATSILVDPQGHIAEIVGTFAVGDLMTRTAAGWVPITKAALSTAIDTAFLASPTPAPDATYAWTTAPNVEVTHAAAKCVITVPAATDVVSWAVGEARRLAVANTGGFGIGFAAIADAGFNYAAVNNAIVTLTGSNVVPAVGVNVPVYTVFRKTAASYLISVGW